MTDTFSLPTPHPRLFSPSYISLCSAPLESNPKNSRIFCCRGVSSRYLLYKWALWPSALFPRARSPVIVRRSPLPDRGCSGAATKVYIITRKRTSNMAAIPSSGSLVATHDYYRRRLGSTSSNSSCGSAEYSGEVIPHHPGLPKSDPGHWWASFFFGKSSHPFMTTVLESPEHSGTFQVAHGTITCDLAQEAMRKRHVSEPSKTSPGPSA